MVSRHQIGSLHLTKTFDSFSNVLSPEKQNCNYQECTSLCTPSANNLPRPLVRNYRLGWGTVGKKAFRFITQTGNIETREVTSRRKKKKKEEENRITGYPALEETNKDHRVQLLSPQDQPKFKSHFSECCPNAP